MAAAKVIRFGSARQQLLLKKRRIPRLRLGRSAPVLGSPAGTLEAIIEEELHVLLDKFVQAEFELFVSLRSRLKQQLARGVNFADVRKAARKR